MFYNSLQKIFKTLLLCFISMSILSGGREDIEFNLFNIKINPPFSKAMKNTKEIKEMREFFRIRDSKTWKYKLADENILLYEKLFQEDPCDHNRYMLIYLIHGPFMAYFYRHYTIYFDPSIKSVVCFLPHKH